MCVCPSGGLPACQCACLCVWGCPRLPLGCLLKRTDGPNCRSSSHYTPPLSAPQTDTTRILRMRGDSAFHTQKNHMYPHKVWPQEGRRARNVTPSFSLSPLTHHLLNPAERVRVPAPTSPCVFNPSSLRWGYENTSVTAKSTNTIPCTAVTQRRGLK